MSVMPDNNKLTSVSDYVPLNERLQNLKTRLDNSDYNEAQRALFANPNLCKDLQPNPPQKVCRFITDCDIPSTEICIVNTGYKETLPPSHHREELPINLLANLVTCCEPGRIACPVLELYSKEADKDVEDMTLHDCIDMTTGKLCLGIDFSHEMSCCDSEEEYDFVRIIPSMKFEYECDTESFEYSGEYLESIELCYKRIEFRRKYHLLLDICEHKLSFEAQLEPLSEKCLACDTSYETYSEASTENACGTLKLKVRNNYNIDWCEPSFSNEMMLEFSQECGDPFVSAGTASTKTQLYGCELETGINQMLVTDFCKGTSILMTNMSSKKRCNDVRTGEIPDEYNGEDCARDPNTGELLKPGSIKINHIGWSFQPVLYANGAINPNLTIKDFDAEICGGITQLKNVVTAVRIDVDEEGKYKLVTSTAKLLFRHGLLVEVEDNDYDEITIPIDCEALKKKCHFCDSCESSESTSPEPESSESTSCTTTSSSSIGSDEESEEEQEDTCTSVYTTAISIPADVYNQYRVAGGRLKVSVDIPSTEIPRPFAFAADCVWEKQDGDPVILNTRLSVDVPLRAIALSGLTPLRATKCYATLINATGLPDYDVGEYNITLESSDCPE